MENPNTAQQKILKDAQELWQLLIIRSKELGKDTARAERDYQVGTALLEALLPLEPDTEFDLPAWAAERQFDIGADVFRVYAYLAGGVGVIEWRFFDGEGNQVPSHVIHECAPLYQDNPEIKEIVFENKRYSLPEITVRFYRTQAWLEQDPITIESSSQKND